MELPTELSSAARAAASNGALPLGESVKLTTRRSLDIITVADALSRASSSWGRPDPLTRNRLENHAMSRAR
jgi:hypothetical protein